MLESSSSLGEQPWVVTVSDAMNFAGTIQLTPNDAKKGWNPRRSTLTLYGPELEIGGFFWIGLAAPSAQDALPDLSNWLSGLDRVFVRTLRDIEPFPSPFVLDFDSIRFDRAT